MSGSPDHKRYLQARNLSGSAQWRRAAKELSAEVARASSRGFTLIELVVTIAIVAILVAIAVPMLSAPQTASEANGLLGALQFARSSAVKLGQNVIVCPTANAGAAQPTCTLGSSWSGGWIVVMPGNGNCTPTTSTGSTAATASGDATGDQVLQVFPAFSGTDTAAFSVIGSNTNTAFCFGRSGFSAAAFLGSVQIDSSPVKLASRRCVAVTGVGHAQVLTHGQSDVSSQVNCQ